MLLLLAILFILFEAVGEGLVLRYLPVVSAIIFKGWVQLLILFILFGAWFIIAFNFDRYYVPTGKIIFGYLFVRFLIFDPLFNLSAGLYINHIGTKKWYDKFLGLIRDMWGMSTIWFARVILGMMGIVFLLGKN